MADSPNSLQRLATTLGGAEAVLILTHDNPDPDALASAFALRHVIEASLGVSATVAFSGMIGRAENRAMIKALELDPQPLSTLDRSAFDAVALVDTQPGTGNNSVDAEWPLRVVIDHHPRRPESAGIAFVDIREDYGASATILHEYLQLAGLDIPVSLATALFYAVRSETLDLGREAGSPDRQAYFELLGQADMAAVARIQRARVPREYFGAFHQAIERAEIFDSLVLTDLGPVAAPDMVAEIADFLLRLQGIEWSCCLGRHQNTLVMSLRTTQPFAHAGRVMRRVVAGAGTAGGHGTMAGGQAPVTDTTYDEVRATLIQRLLATIGVRPDVSEDLVRS